MKDSNGVSGRARITCPCYEELDAILGPRAAPTPPVVLDSGVDATATGLSERVAPEQYLLTINYKHSFGIEEPTVQPPAGGSLSNGGESSVSATSTPASEFSVPDGDTLSVPSTSAMDIGGKVLWS